MKVVINTCYGGFSISLAAARWMAERGHEGACKDVQEYDQQDAWIKEFLSTGAWPKACPKEAITWLDIDARYFKGRAWNGGLRSCKRNDPLLVQVVQVLGDKANGDCASLKVIEIPDNVDWEIAEYDGNEHVAQKHETWE